MSFFLSPWKEWCVDFVSSYTTTTMSHSWKKICEHELFQRIEFAIAVHRDRYVIIAGGNRGDGVGIKSSGIYDLKTDRHTELPDLPEDFHSNYCGGVVLNNYYYVYSLFFKEAMYRINLSKRQRWEKVASHMNEDIRVVANNRRLFALSGYQNTTYDQATDTWSALPPMKTPRQHFACTMVEDKIYTIGGCKLNESEKISSVEVFDLLSQSWTSAPPLPNPLAYASATATGKWIIVTGGRNENDEMLNCTYFFDLVRQKWIESDTSLSSPRQHHRVVIVGEEVVTVGGCSDEERSSIFSIETINKRHLIPNLDTIDELLRLRKLVDQERATPRLHKRKNVEMACVQDIVTSVPDDVFRHISSFTI